MQVDPNTLIGTTIDEGRLRILAHIGTGGFGVVFRVLELATGTELALKCMPKAPRGSPAYARQKLEMAVHTQLSGHANVVRFHRWIDGGPWIMFLFDLCAGGDLFRAIVARRCVGDDHAVRRVFGQMLAAVSHCHAHGVYHRDLKPENLLCTPDLGAVFLTDFGLATTDELTNDFRVGSPVYMSPECIQADFRLWCPAPQSDVWALGVLLFSLLTARVPWLSAVPTDPNFAHYAQWPHLLFSRSPPLADDVKRLVLAALDVNPYRRISLLEFQARFERIERFFPEPAPDPALALEAPAPTLELERVPLGLTWTTQSGPSSSSSPALGTPFAHPTAPGCASSTGAISAIDLYCAHDVDAVVIA